MADDRILLKRSGVPGEIPLPESLELGELALNYADNAVYMKLLDGTVAEIGGLPTSNNTIYVSVSGDDNNTGRDPGQPKRTIRAALNDATPFTTIDIAAGTYFEKTPLILPQFTTVHGVDQRITTVRPEDPTKDVFWVSNSCYITGLAIRGHQKPSFCVAFPGNVEIGIAQSGSTSNTIVLDSANSVTGTGMDDYYREMRVNITGGTGNGQSRGIVAYDNATRTATVNTAWSTVPDNTSTYYIDIPIPDTPVANTARFSSHITASPYLYNLASVTADIPVANSTTNLAIGLGIKTLTVETGLSSFTTANYLRLYNDAINFMVGKVTSYSSANGQLILDVTKAVGRGSKSVWEVKVVCGAGMEIDGYKAAGLRSMVSAQFTQFNSGGDGVVMRNMGYAQLVSIYGICCEDAFLAESGGTSSMGNCNVNFGNRGLVANGVGPLLMTGKSGFVFDTIKCERDTRLIANTLSVDVLFSGNSQSVFAGIQYWNQDTVEGVPVEQLAPTIATFQYISDLVGKIVVLDTGGTRYQNAVSQNTTAAGTATSTEKAQVSNGVNTVISILQNGITGVTDNIVFSGITANSDPNNQNAYSLLQANKSYLQAEALAYVASQYPSLVYDTAKCSRDVGYIVDSISFDFKWGGNKQAIQSGVYYYGYTEESAVGDEIPQTIAAYNHIKDLASYVVRGVAVPSELRYQSAVSQSNVGDIPGTTTEVAVVNTNIDLITNIIANGPDVAPAASPVGLTANATLNAQNAAAQLYWNSNFIANEVIAYLEAEYGANNQTGFEIKVSNIVACTDPRFAITSNTKPYLGLVMNIEGETTFDIQLGPGYLEGDTVNIAHVEPTYTDYMIGTISTWDVETETANVVITSASGLGNIHTTWTTTNGTVAGRFTQEFVVVNTGTLEVISWDTSLIIPKYRTITEASSNGDITTLTLDERITGSLTIDGVRYPDGLPANANVYFYQKSALSASGQTFEFVGSGTSTAVALPRNGGDIIQANETVSSNGGIVYFTSTDQFGNFRIGEDLTINFNTGTLSGRTFTRSLFAQITPFVLALDS
jgi:hypothetical protein